MLRFSTGFWVLYVYIQIFCNIQIIYAADSSLDNVGAIGGPAMLHFEPQVAVMCDSGPQGPEYFHSQYMTEQGHWQTDLTSKPICPKEKMMILDFCKKVYPKRDITNIVESSHYMKVSNWCRSGASNNDQARGKCKTQRWIKPFRCLEGPFQSDALLVPEGCAFDHVHNATRCWPFSRWNGTAGAACNERGLQLRSFAMLLPCGISLFSGVEFVCCPKHFKDNMKSKKVIDVSSMKNSPFAAMAVAPTDDSLESDQDQDDVDDTDLDDDLSDDREFADDPNAGDNNNTDEDDDDDEDDYYDENDTDYVTPSNNKIVVGGASTKQTSSSTTSSTTTSTTTTTTTTPSTTTSTTEKSTPIPTPDPYFTHFDPRIEHESYKQAQERLEETHREKVTKVMKNWSDLEERYQDMRALDINAADAFKARMTRRFQQTVQTLEDEADAEKRQLAAMHQQRVLAHINQRKKEAMQCYTHALNEHNPNTHKVQKCLQKLLRALHKDRAHAIAHYRHLLASSIEAASREQPRILERLTDVDHTVNQSMQMLQRIPELNNKIGQLMTDYIQALRSKDDTPGSLLALTPEAEAALLDKYRMDIVNKQLERKQQRIQEQQRKEQRKKERNEIQHDEKKRVEAVLGKKITDFDDADDMEYEIDQQPTFSSTQSSSTLSENGTEKSTETHTAYVDDAAVQRAVEEASAAIEHQEIVRVAHAMRHDISHEPSYSVRREVYGHHESGRSVYFTLAFAGLALMAAAVAGVAVAARRRAARHPHAHGFVEVDQAATPEERHVANMQINGYENPTYKYFEVKE